LESGFESLLESDFESLLVSLFDSVVDSLFVSLLPSDVPDDEDDLDPDAARLSVL
jgi:hypothetical protein